MKSQREPENARRHHANKNSVRGVLSSDSSKNPPRMCGLSAWLP